MRRTFALLMGSATLIVAACNASVDSPGPTAALSSAAPSPAASSDAADVTRYFSIGEVGLGPDGWVTLRNYTDQPASIGTGYLCQTSGCVDLPDVVVGPGEVARIAAGDGANLQSVAMTGASLDLPPADGEVAFLASDDRDDPSKVRAYLEWGSTPHDLTDVAIEAGLWREGTYAPSGPNATRLWKTDANLWVWDPGTD